jgi:Flp pilus assembly protein TadD
MPEAIAHLRRAVALAPDSAVAHSDLGGALAQAGQREEALMHIRKALALDPQNTAARENLARLQGGRH